MTALDIQMQTQFGQGSGVSFGFSSPALNEAAYAATAGDGSAEMYLALLLLKPKVDVFSWSFHAPSSPTKSSEATLAKFAAMGVTVIVSSGDSGVFYRDPSIRFGTCDDAVTSGYPGASAWVSLQTGFCVDFERLWFTKT